ncbi:MFS general substrate transporter, partial [Fistulina hepatica ATCC 64428]
DEEEWTYPDGGLRAWLVVLGCFILSGSGLCWGQFSSFVSRQHHDIADAAAGVFQEYYKNHVFTDTTLGTLSLVGGILSFCSMTTSYLAGGLGDRYGYKKMIALSCMLTFLSILGASFMTKLWQIFLFQGVFQGISQGLSMPLYLALPSQWFLHHRALASGISVSGAGIGGACYSLVLRPLLTRLGYRKTLLVYACINAVLSLIAYCLLRVRFPPGEKAAKKRWLPRHVDLVFASLAGGMLFSQFGYLSPFYYMTSYTEAKVPSLNEESLVPTIPLVIVNLCAGIGRIGCGMIADACGPINMFMLGLIFGGILQLVFWTFATSFGSIIAFDALFGVLGTSFIGLLPAVCARVFGTEGLATITGLLVLFSGPGQLAGPPIAGVIYAASGDNWQMLSIFSGAMMLAGGLCVLYGKF